VCSCEHVRVYLFEERKKKPMKDIDGQMFVVVKVVRISLSSKSKNLIIK
jgi:hypothetical protein